MNGFMFLVVFKKIMYYCLFFSLCFINNLVDVKSLNVSIPIGVEKLCILLHADDIVLLDN